MDSEEELLLAFRVFDPKNTGYIHEIKLRNILLNMGEKLSEEEVNELLYDIDIDNNGNIKYAELINILTPI